MRLECSVPVTPEPIQLAGLARNVTFEVSGLARDDDRWSARRTLLFIVTANSLLWWAIVSAVRMFG